MRQPGEVLKGKYRIERVLGEGGMGVVVAAQHIALEEMVAIKFLRAEMLAHSEIVARFAREAKAATKIKSDHIARVLDVDTLEDGTPFMVMEYLEGYDLAVVRRQQTPLPIGTAASYVLEACEAIAEAHRLGIIHRDLKPANLFLAHRPDGKKRVKVLDFGISKMDAPGGTGPSVTKTSAIMGSAEYMSPEQMMASRNVDARTDIWALGVTLYELLTCSVPFPGETITHVCALVMTQPPAAPSTVRPDVPAALDAIVLKCMARDPSGRYASVAELAAALAPWAATTSSVTRASIGDGAPLTMASVTPAMSARSGPPVFVSTTGGTVLSGDGHGDGPTIVAGSSSPGLPSGATASPVSSDAPGRTAPARSPIWLGVALAAIAVCAAGSWLAFGGPARSSAAIATSEPTTAAIPTVAPLASAAPSASAIAVTPAADAPALAPSVVPTASPSVAPAATTVRAPSKPPAGGRLVTRPAHRDCNPPYTIGSDGLHHAKPECM